MKTPLRQPKQRRKNNELLELSIKKKKSNYAQNDFSYEVVGISNTRESVFKITSNAKNSGLFLIIIDFEELR